MLSRIKNNLYDFRKKLRVRRRANLRKKLRDGKKGGRSKKLRGGFQHIFRLENNMPTDVQRTARKNIFRLRVKPSEAIEICPLCKRQCLLSSPDCKRGKAFANTLNNEQEAVPAKKTEEHSYL